MSKPLRVLIVEDSEDDALLVLRELERRGYEVTSQRVETAEAMSAALDEESWDIILADYAMPQFSGPAALELLQGKGLDLPFIVVSGTIGEEVAVACMRVGAHDYLLKDNLARLTPAVERELRDVEVRRQRTLAEEALHESEERLRAIFEAAKDVSFIITDLAGTEARITEFSPGAEHIFGYQREEVIGKPLAILHLPEDVANFAASIQALREGKSGLTTETVLARKSGETFPALLTLYPLVDDNGDLNSVLGVTIDITERKRAEEALRKRTHDLEERVKELDCLYTASRLMARVDRSPDEVFRGIVDLVPSGWQYPDITCARITIEGQQWATDNFEQTAWKQSADIAVSGEPVGSVEVYYLQERPAADEGPFLKEERDLTDTLARQIGTFTERKRAEERIEHLNAVLRAIRGVNQLIVREKDRDRLLRQTCDILSTRGYHSTWLALLDEEGRFLTAAQAGRGGEFQPLLEMLQAGNFPECARRSLVEGGVVVFTEPASCGECPLGAVDTTWAGASVRLEFEERVYGVLTVSLPAQLATDEEEQGLIREVADDLAYALRSLELDAERRQAEEEVAQAARQWHDTFDAVEDLVSIIGKDYRVLRGNLAMYRAFHGTEVLGAHCYELFHGTEGPLPECPTYQTLLSGQAEHFERREPHLDNRWFDFFGYPIKDKEGTVQQVVHVVRDITERKRTEEELRQSFSKLQKIVAGAIQTMARIVEIRDPYTAGHQQRVAALARAIAVELHVPQDQVAGLYMAGSIHDVGKISVPAEILSKPGRLSDLEFDMIKAHSFIGYDILSGIEFPWPIADIVLQHHERMDGSGYPKGLAGEDIRLEARILGVADVVEAMASHRPYRPARGQDAALEEISQNKGVLYDPQVADACLRLFAEKGFKLE